MFYQIKKLRPFQKTYSDQLYKFIGVQVVIIVWLKKADLSIQDVPLNETDANQNGTVFRRKELMSLNSLANLSLVDRYKLKVIHGYLTLA